MPTPLRIGLVCPYSLTIPGGVQAQVMGLARVLRRMGHEARVLAPCDGPPPATYVTPLGNSVPTAANGSIAPLAPDPSASLRIMRALHDEDFDVLHLHEPLAPGPTMTALLLDSAPSVGTFHAAGDSASYRYGNRPLRWLDSHIDARCVVSKDALELVERYFGVTDYEMLFNGVELDRYRAIAPTKTDRPTIFFCGRHEPRKGLSVLLAALARLPADVRCWVASDGPETEELKARHAGDARIEWLGRLSEEEKISRLAGATVFCAPSVRGESFGVVLIEAMAAGTPIVSTDLPGYLNVATPGHDALMVPPDDPDALAEGLQRVLADDELADELRRNGAERAEDFSMDTLARRYIAIYERLAGMTPAQWQGARSGPPGSSVPERLRRMLDSTSPRRRTH
ncbi:MAG: glycosyltransferase family 4 protein [Acidimicrobiia bacterium]